MRPWLGVLEPIRGCVFVILLSTAHFVLTGKRFFFFSERGRLARGCQLWNYVHRGSCFLIWTLLYFSASHSLLVRSPYEVADVQCCQLLWPNAPPSAIPFTHFFPFVFSAARHRFYDERRAVRPSKSPTRLCAPVMVALHGYSILCFPFFFLGDGGGV